MVHSFWFKRYKDLTGQALCRLRESLNTSDYILIGEYSMLGQVTFGWIDKGCKLATGFNDKVLGGKSLILILVTQVSYHP